MSDLILPSVSTPSTTLVGNVPKSSCLNRASSASLLKSSTSGRPHLSSSFASAAMSRMAWLVGSWPTPSTAITKYPRPVCESTLTSAPSFANFDSLLKLPITHTSSSEVRTTKSASVVAFSSMFTICVVASTLPFAKRVPVTSR